jgi:hypothetical protein
MERRVILVSERLIGGAGLLVSRMLGLRNPEQFNAAAKPRDAPAWVAGAFVDAAGTKCWSSICRAGARAAFPGSRRLRRRKWRKHKR